MLSVLSGAQPPSTLSWEKQGIPSAHYGSRSTVATTVGLFRINTLLARPLITATRRHMLCDRTRDTSPQQPVNNYSYWSTDSRAWCLKHSPCRCMAPHCSSLLSWV